MLGAGKPVIVPGGSWLASQIAEPIFAHIETLCARLPNVACRTGGELRWQTSEGNLVRQRSGNRLELAEADLLTTQLPVPPAATELVVGFRWPDDTPREQFLNVQLAPIARDGKAGQPQDCIVGGRRGDAPALAIFHLDAGPGQITLRVRNPQENHRIVVTDFLTRFLRASHPHGCPAGSVGLIAAHPAQIPVMLRDMVQHYDHYRESAIAFSHTWNQAHHPSQTIAMLTGGPARGRLAA
jgi:hypothetical protein